MCPVSEMKRSVAFYRDLLGAAPVYESEGWSEFRLPNGVRLGLHGGASGESRGGFVLGLEVASLVDAKARLEAAGHAVPGEPHEIPGGREITVVDPDGNAIQLMEYGAKG